MLALPISVRPLRFGHKWSPRTSRTRTRLLLTGDGAELSGRSGWARFAVEGIDQVAFHLALDDAIGDADREKIAILVRGGIVEGDTGDDDPFLPAFHGVDHVMADQALQHLIVRFEHQVLEFRAEFRAHEPFARPGAENLDDALVDVFVFGGGGRRDLRATGPSMKTEGELQPASEEIQGHQSRSSQMQAGTLSEPGFPLEPSSSGK